MSNDKCPCEDCICLAICRHKEYLKLFHDCELLRTENNFDRIYTKRKVRLPTIQNVLNPTRWKVGSTGIILICDSEGRVI